MLVGAGVAPSTGGLAVLVGAGVGGSTHLEALALTCFLLREDLLLEDLLLGDFEFLAFGEPFFPRAR